MSEVKKPVISEPKKSAKVKLKEFPFKPDSTYLLKLADGNYCVGVLYNNAFEENVTGNEITDKIEAYIPLEEIIDEQ